jgi:uncharacterized membrane protein
MNGEMLANVQLHPVLGATGEALLLLLAGGYCVWEIRRSLPRGRRALTLAILKVAALAALLTLLFQAQWRRDEVNVLKPRLAVLVDVSESMIDQADPAQSTRTAQVGRWLETALPESAARQFDVEFFAFSDTPAPVTAGDRNRFKTADGKVSNVVAAVDAVRERYRGQSLAGILVLSDGIDTNAVKPTQGRKEDGIVCTFELERPYQAAQIAKRVAIDGVDFLPRMVVGWDGEITVRVSGQGLRGETTAVELWRDGQKQSEGAAAFQEDAQTRDVIFPISHDKPGRYAYEVKLPGEFAAPEAQTHAFQIEVVEAGSRVLYVQNSLSFDFKFLRKAIVADRNLELRSFVRWGDGRLVAIGSRGRPDAAAGLDLSEAALLTHAVVILGDLPPAVLRPEQQAALRKFVDQGGGLVMLGGAAGFAAAPGWEATPLADLIPVQLPAPHHEGKYPVAITEDGLRHPVFGPLFQEVKNFPPLLTANFSPAAKASTETLLQAQADGQMLPLVVGMRFGHGRVVAILTDTIWRWRLASEAWRGRKSPYETFWAQLMDWMLPKEDERRRKNEIELFTERNRYVLGEKPLVRALVRLADAQAKPPASLPLDVQTPDGKVFNYTLTKTRFRAQGSDREVDGYEAAVEPHVAGNFKAVASAPVGGETLSGEAAFAVTPPPSEKTGRPIDRQRLTELAQKGGGKFYAIDQWAQWVADVKGQEQRFSTVRLVSLWNHPALIGGCLFLLVSEWFLRRRWSLP